MAIYKRGKRFWYEFMHNGKRIRKSTGSSDHSLATRAEIAHKRRLEVCKIESSEIDTAAVQMIPGSKTLLTVEEAAKSMTIKPSTLRAWIAAKQIGVCRIGRSVRIPAFEVERIIKEGFEPSVQGRNSNI